MNVGTTLKAKHLRKPIWDGLIKPFISNLNKANTLPVRLSVDNVFDLTVDGSPAMLATSIAVCGRVLEQHIADVAGQVVLRLR